MKSECEKLVRLASGSESNVLLTGPTGSGKSCIARKIHEASARRGKPFVAVNLAALHEGVLESELFGHERGAFTGADHRRTGKLEAADGGSVFLDEIAELQPRLQARLLEFLQSRTISPVGANRDKRLNVRVIAATHRNIRAAVSQGEFREDLYHRIRVIEIRMPSIAEQSDEFDSIVHTCIEELAGNLGRKVRALSEDAASLLENYHWPGNFRELRNVIEFAILSCGSEVLQASHFPQWLHEEIACSRKIDSPPESMMAADSGALEYRLVMSRFEERFLRDALQRNGGRVSSTAREVGMSKATLIRRLKTHGIGFGRGNALQHV